MRKLKYEEPVITRIKLDPEQAVLAACSTSIGHVGSTGAGCFAAGDKEVEKRCRAGYGRAGATRSANCTDQHQAS